MPRSKSQKPVARSSATPFNPKSSSNKADVLINLLQNEPGPTIQELAGAMAWQPHTIRAALTRLRQAGWVIEKVAPREGERGVRYKIAEPAT